MSILMGGPRNSFWLKSGINPIGFDIGFFLSGVGTIILSAGAAASQTPSRQSAAIEAGRQLFIRCVACHSVTAAAPVKAGPHLEGILGRPVASVQGYRYSTAIQSMSFIWTKPRFEKLLRQLQRVAPGLCVPFTGFAARRDRENLIAFLERPDS